MNLILVRHGETDWNSTRRYQGQLDIPLNSRGHWQAQRVAQVLAGEPIQRLVSSDLQRALETAMAIGTACNLAVATDARLREISFGSWEGLGTDEIQRQDGEAYRRWKENPVAHAPTGGETLASAGERILSAWQEIRALPLDTVAIVAHGGSLRILLSHLLQLPPESFWQIKLGNASLSRIRITRTKVTLDQLNDVRHLPAVDQGFESAY